MPADNSATDLRYPIGKFQRPENIDDKMRKEFIRQISEAPTNLRKAVSGLTDSQLDTPYRPDGWTVRQVVHHLADSHLNAYVRLKLALTEQEPLIKPYNEADWAKLHDSRTGPIEMSVSLLESLHKRWVMCLQSMDTSQFARTMRHPERGLMSIDTVVALYAWHGRHHVAHITSLRERKGWK
ncbi:MAG: YfiT family bacillithiol transferase [Bacteroidota bacterium]|jgi:uncharacterized damage-inducible protein DinB